MNIVQGQDVVSRHDEITESSQQKSKEKRLTWQFLKMVKNIVKLIDPELIMEDPEGCREKQKAEKRSKETYQFCLHRMPSFDIEPISKPYLSMEFPF